ncbi:MAG TPA: hypothetical protein VIJ71_10200 [Mycobacteriales bacterium]
MSADSGTPPPEDQPEWSDWSSDTLHAPDDISSLSADVLAFRREDRARRRRQRWLRLAGWGRARGYGVSVPMILAAALVVVGLGTLLVVVGPSGTGRPTGDLSVGRPGGTIQPVSLAQVDGQTFPATSIVGPAAVLLVPSDCRCAGLVPIVVRAAVGAHLHPYVIETTVDGARTDVAAVNATATALVDRAGILLADYGSLGTAPTLLRLDAQGHVRSVRTGVTGDDLAAAVLAG